MSILEIIVASIVGILFVSWVIYDIIRSIKLKKEKRES